MISNNELRQLADHYYRQCAQISAEEAMTVPKEEDRHFRAGKARTLAYLYEGYSKAAILEKAKKALGMAQTKLSRPEGHAILLRAIAAAFSEWDSRA